MLSSLLSFFQNRSSLSPSDRIIAIALLLTAYLSSYSPWSSPPLALCSGLAFALSVGNPLANFTNSLSKILQQWCVIGLGFGLNIGVILAVSFAGIGTTMGFIGGTILLGIFLARLLKMSPRFGYLIAVGTAICGASAMTALAPIIHADDDEFSIGLGVVFILNGLALVLFPFFGGLLDMTQQQFGTWSALAIHDTSSVVGAAQRYGKEALNIAITMKLARALWILPIALCTALFLSWQKQRKDSSDHNDISSPNYRIDIPWFIGGFILASCVRTTLPMWGIIPEATMQVVASSITLGSKIGLHIVLFCVGANVSRSALRQVGAKPLVFGTVLWCVVSMLSLIFVRW